MNSQPSTQLLIQPLRRNYSTLAAVALSAFVFAIIWSQMSSSVFPPGDDIVDWSKRVNQPLFFIICQVISTVLGDSLLALKLAAALAFSAIPLTTYMLSKKVAGSPIAGLAAALIVASFPGHHKMLWWGAYPTLLGLALIPVALLALLEAQRGNHRYLCLAIILGALLLTAHHLTFMVYLAILIIATLASIVARDKKSLRINILTLAAILALFISHWYVAGLASILQNPTTSEPGVFVIEAVFWLFESPLLLCLIVAAAIIGLAQLFFWRRFKELTLTLGWLTGSLLLTQVYYLGVSVDYERFLFSMMIPLSILTSVPLLHLRHCVKISKVIEENPVYEVVIQLEKAVPVMLMLIVLLVTPVQGLEASGRAYAHYTWDSKYGDQERLQVLDWIKLNTGEETTVVSDIQLGRWVEVYAHRRALFSIPLSIFTRGGFERSQAAEAIMNSSYRLANEHIKIDEWQPMSNRFSSVISVFQDTRYVELLGIDDAFVSVKLTRNGKTWTEDPNDAWLYQSRWLERSSEGARLQLLFRTMGLLIEKELDVQARQHTAVVTYRVEPKQNVTLNAISLNLYLILRDVKLDKNRAKLITNAGSVELAFIGKLLKLELGMDEWFNRTVNRVHFQFKPESEKAEIRVLATALNPQSSWIRGVWAASSSELERQYGVTHIALPIASHATQRFKASLPEGPAVYVDDAFAKVTFTKAGRQWVEAPYKARVLSEETKTLGNVKVCVTSYETVSLYINKTIAQRDSSLEVKYGVKAKEEALLQGFQLSLWLPPGRMVSDAEVQDRKMLLVTDAGALEIAPMGEVLGMGYGVDEELQLPRILLSYPLKPEQDEISLTITSLNEGSKVEAQVEATTRPIMEASDKTTIVTRARRYREVFRDADIVIYEAPKY